MQSIRDLPIWKNNMSKNIWLAKLFIRRTPLSWLKIQESQLRVWRLTNLWNPIVKRLPTLRGPKPWFLTLKVPCQISPELIQARLQTTCHHLKENFTTKIELWIKRTKNFKRECQKNGKSRELDNSKRKTKISSSRCTIVMYIRLRKTTNLLTQRELLAWLPAVKILVMLSRLQTWKSLHKLNSMKPTWNTEDSQEKICRDYKQIWSIINPPDMKTWERIRKYPLMQRICKISSSAKIF